MLNQRVLIGAFILSGISGLVVSLYVHHAERADEIIVPTVHYPVMRMQQLANDPQVGEKIFNEFCSTCHAKHPLIDVKAPAIGDKSYWEPRRKIGIKQLLRIAINGVGAMPARGGCFECSDQQLQATIKYILDKSH